MAGAKHAWASALGILAAAAWAIMRAPLAPAPDPEDPIAVAQTWPVRPGDWRIDHLSDSPVGLLIARSLDLLSAEGLIRLGVIATALVMIGLAAWAWVAAAAERSRAARLALLLPVVAVMLFWLGSADPFTMLAWLIALAAWLSGRRWVLAVCAIPLGFQHFAVAVLGVAALAFTWRAIGDRRPARTSATDPLWMLPGVIGGKLLLVAVMAANTQALDGRGPWLQTYFESWTKVAIVTAPLLLWSLLAGAWPMAIVTWQQHSALRSRVLLGAALACGLLATAIAADRPRIFELVMTPSLLLVIAWFSSSDEVSVRTKRLAETVAWIAPPVILAGSTVANVNVVDQTLPVIVRIVGWQ